MIERSISASGRAVGQDHPNTRYTDEQVAQVRQMHFGGLSYQRVAQQTGIPKATVADWVTGACRSLPRAGVSKQATEDDYPIIRDLRLRGMTREQICNTTGYSKASVSVALESMNLNKRMRRK